MYPLWIAFVFMVLVSTAALVNTYKNERTMDKFSEDVAVTRLVQYRMAVLEYVKDHPSLGDETVTADQLSGTDGGKSYWTTGYSETPSDWSNYVQGSGTDRTVYIFSTGGDMASLGNAVFNRASSSKLIGFKDPNTKKLISLDYIPLDVQLDFVGPSGEEIIPDRALVIVGM